MINDVRSKLYRWSSLHVPTSANVCTPCLKFVAVRSEVKNLLIWNISKFEGTIMEIESIKKNRLKTKSKDKAMSTNKDHKDETQIQIRFITKQQQ